MKHLNSNLLCAVAIKTTGSVPDKHQLLEIAIVPLTSKCEIDKRVLPFNVLFNVDEQDLRRAEYSIETEMLYKLSEYGYDKYEAAELFEIWYSKLGLRSNKRIVPLCHNWVTKCEFLRQWLQPTGYSMTFHEEYRDPQVIGLYLNDRADFKNERCPFPKVKLGYMASQLKIEYVNRLPTVIDECVTAIKLYKSLITNNIF